MATSNVPMSAIITSERTPAVTVSLRSWNYERTTPVSLLGGVRGSASDRGFPGRRGWLADLGDTAKSILRSIGTGGRRARALRRRVNRDGEMRARGASEGIIRGHETRAQCLSERRVRRVIGREVVPQLQYAGRSEEHTSELQSRFGISYA